MEVQDKLEDMALREASLKQELAAQQVCIII